MIYQYVFNTFSLHRQHSYYSVYHEKAWISTLNLATELLHGIRKVKITISVIFRCIGPCFDKILT